MATKVQTYNRMLDEILAEANASETPVQVLKQYLNGDNPFFRKYIELATNEDFLDFDLDSVIFTQYDYHRSSAGSQAMNRHVFNVIETILFSKTLSTVTKKKQYKAMMELLYKEEADALHLVLTKNVVSAYPKLTIEVLTEALDA